MRNPATSGTQQTNQSLPPVQPNATSYSLTNTNNMTTKNAGNKPAAVYYWIMADYKDGGYSPMYGPIKITL
jgi:hypothetical protein